MRTWTVVFVCVAALVVVVGGEISWDGVLLAARIGFAALVVASLLIGVRAMTRQMSVPPDHAVTRPGAHPPTRRTDAGPGITGVTRAERRSAAVSSRGLRGVEQGEIR